MREIKFRAWIRQGEWNKEGDNQAYEMCYALAFEDFEPLNDLLASVEHLMQYTGFKDKNDTEIYERDIVKHKFGQGQVFDRNGCWFIEMYQELGYTLKDTIEVIGNIYENPELISKEV